MTLKDKRKIAFLDFLKTVYTIEELLYSYKDTIFQMPAIPSNKEHDDDYDKLSYFELVFISVYKVQQKYIKVYSLLVNCLKKASELNKKYKLGYLDEITTLDSRISKIEKNVEILKKIPVIQPAMIISEDNLRFITDEYDKFYANVLEIIMTCRFNVNVSSFNYRKYFKDDFYTYMKGLVILLDLTTGSLGEVVKMDSYTIIGQLNGDYDDVQQTIIEDYYPKK